MSLLLGGPEVPPDVTPGQLATGLLHDPNKIDGKTRMNIWRVVLDFSTDPSEAVTIAKVHGTFENSPDVDVTGGLRQLARLGMITELPLAPGEIGLDRKIHRTDSRGWELVRQIIDFADSEDSH